MKKLIAKTTNGKEYLHSTVNAFFANTNAQKIANILNENKYQLNDNEHWHVYEYDVLQDVYVKLNIFISKNSIKAKVI